MGEEEESKDESAVLQSSPVPSSTIEGQAKWQGGLPALQQSCVEWQCSISPRAADHGTFS